MNKVYLHFDDMHELSPDGLARAARELNEYKEEKV